MRIGYDCHTIGSNLGGNETYAYNLLTALTRLDTRNEYVLYHTRTTEKLTALARLPNVRLTGLSPHTPFVRIPVALPVALAREPVDVLHVQYVPPPFTRTPLVTMIHDLASLYFPRFFTRWEHWRNRVLLPWAARRSTRLLTVSEFSKEQIVRAFGVPAAKVTVTYNGISDALRPADAASIRETLARYHVDQPYVLFVGNIQPRKNLRGVVKACRLLRTEHGLPHRLVVVGKKAWLFADAFASVREMGMETDVTFTGFVPDGDLPALYSGAAVLMYPSFFEGFGLPPLEAMACGTPAVVSREPAFPEIVGDAALLANPDDPHDIADQAARAITDPALRERLIERGRRRAAEFTWEKCASQTLAVLEGAAAGRTRGFRS